MIMRYFLITTALILSVKTVFSQLPAVETGKLFTEDAGVIDCGTMEITSGVQFTQSNTKPVVSTSPLPGDRQTAYDVEFGYGITNAVNLAVGFGWLDTFDYTASSRVNGPADVLAKLKYRIHEAGSFSISALTGMLIPIRQPQQSSGGEEQWFFEQHIIGTGVIGLSSYSADASIAFPFMHEGSMPLHLSLNVAAGYQVSEVLQPVIEWNFHHDVVPEGDATGLAMTIGALLSVPGGMKVSFAIQEALLRLIPERQHVFRLSLMMPVTLLE